MHGKRNNKNRLKNGLKVWNKKKLEYKENKKLKKQKINLLQIMKVIKI